MICLTSGHKATLEKVFNDIKNLRINGNKYFSPNEYLHISQIKSCLADTPNLNGKGS